jgi:hypothetical protein
MINVLDHVRDVDLCLHNATRITKKGGGFPPRPGPHQPGRHPEIPS